MVPARSNHLAVICLAFVVIGAAGFATLASAQTSGPTGDAPPVCPPNRAEPGPGTFVTAGPVIVQVPEGRYHVLESPSGSGFVNICVEGAGGVRIDNDCSEVSRYVDADAGDAVLDAIVESCRPALTPVATVGASAPTGPSGPPPPAATMPSGDDGISPPNTGSGGLR